MPGVSDFVAAVDSFMAAADKSLVLGPQVPEWRRVRDEDFVRIKLPLEVAGEQLGQHLLIDAYTEHPTLKFCIGIMFPEGVVCRLDYELEAVHGNGFAYGLPLEVQGPHWHSWELNRLSFKDNGHFLKLPYATTFHDARQFDATLRWYCAQRHIALGAHGIEFPPRGRLL
jgi:hypothetical protein